MCSFPTFGDSVTGSASVIVGIHDSTQSQVRPMSFRFPPSPKPLPLAAFVWQPFNKREYAVSLSMTDGSFEADVDSGAVATLPSESVLASLPDTLKPMYYLHARGADSSVLAGAAVLSLDSLCPPFDGSPNTNMFRDGFGIEFHAEGHTHVRPFSPFEFTSCFGFIDRLRYRLSHPTNRFALDAGVPALTSAWLMDHIHERLAEIRDSNTEIFSPNQYAAPAAHIQSFVSGVIATRLPDRARWIQAIATDPELSKIRDIVSNPSTLNNKSLAGINYNYHAAGHTHGSSSSQRNSVTSYLSPFMPTPSVATSTHTELYTAFVYDIIGRVCIHTSRRCAPHAQVVPIKPYQGKIRQACVQLPY